MTSGHEAGGVDDMRTAGTRLAIHELDWRDGWSVGYGCRDEEVVVEFERAAGGMSEA